MLPTFITPVLPRSYRLNFNSPTHTSLNPRRPRWRAATDWYELLQIPSTADTTTIKRAYRRAALKNHPDVSKASDAKERFLRIQEAYSVLSDKDKRATYDRTQRMRNSGFGDNVWSGGSGTGTGTGTGTGGFDVGEFSKQWRERNPMPEDLDDNLGNILSDLFEGVKEVVGEGGVVEDFVEFLERGVGGMGGEDADVLRSNDVDVLEAEVEDAKFVLEQLKKRRERLEEEVGAVGERAGNWGKRAERAGNDYSMKEAARERERELRMEERRLEARAKKTGGLIERQKGRLRKLEVRLNKVKMEKEQNGRERGVGVEVGRGGEVRAQKSQKEVIDEELERMKKELGL